MDNIKNIILGIAVTLALVSGGILFKTVDNVDSLGAVSSPNIQAPYFSFGGVRQWASKTTNLTAATTTPCILVSPVATSTLTSVAVNLTTSTTTAYTLTIATSSPAVYATTTPLAVKSEIANYGTTLFHLATSTFNGGSGVMAPRSLVVVSMTGGVGTFSPTGSCQATWQTIQ